MNSSTLNITRIFNGTSLPTPMTARVYVNLPEGTVMTIY